MSLNFPLKKLLSLTSPIVFGWNDTMLYYPIRIEFFCEMTDLVSVAYFSWGGNA